MIEPTAQSWTAMLEEELKLQRERHLWRELRPLDGTQGPEIEWAGRRVVNFSSNDYLGLAAEPVLIEVMQEAVGRYGVGAGASRLISGNQSPHRQLDEALADFKKTEAALSYSCGFSTAVGTIPALVGTGDVILMDKLCHACLVDGARLSGATLRIFPHNEVGRLEEQLRWARAKFPHGRLLILTESVFSMDGDWAPLRELVAVKEKFGAWLLVDEAHGVGVLGPGGRGLVEELGLSDAVEIQMGTLGKALGVAGGYIAGSRALVDLLINRSRSFIFSTAPPPAQAAAAAAAVRWVQTPDGITRLEALTSNRRQWSDLNDAETMAPSAIIPIAVGGEGRAVEMASAFLQEGLFVPAVRFPTVPKGKARLRLTLTARHTAEHLRAVADLLKIRRGDGFFDKLF